MKEVYFIENETIVNLNSELFTNWKNLQILILKNCLISKVMIFDFPLHELKVLSIRGANALVMTIYTDVC